MSAKIRLLSVASILLLTSVGLFAFDWLGSDTEPDGAGVGQLPGGHVVGDAGVSADPTVGAGGEGRTSDRDGSRREVTAQGPWQVAGTITDGRGHGLRPFRLRIDVYNGMVAPLGPGAALTESRQAVHTTEVRTGEDGRFFWAWEAPNRAVTLRLRPGDGEHAYGERFLVVAAKEHPPRDVEVAFSLLDGLVEGQVTDEDGKPIPGAAVHWYNYVHTKAEEDGRYKLRMPAGRLPVMCYAPGFTGQSRPVNISQVRSGLGDIGGRPVKYARQNFVLTRGFKVSGVVQDEAGNPIAGARVHCWSVYWQPERTDAEGRFEFDHLPSGRDEYSIGAHHPDYVQGHAKADPSNPTVTITMRAGATMTGRVVDPQNQPVEGALVFVRTAALNNNEPDAISGRDGTFTVRALRSDTFHVTARKRGFALASRKVGVPRSGSVDHVELQLGESRELKGVVTDQVGRPIANATVTFSLDGGLDTSLGSDVRTGRDGRFVAAGLPNQAVTVLALCKGYQRRSSTGHVPGGPEVHLRLRREAWVAGRVVDGNTGKPIPQFRVRLVWPTLEAGERSRVSGFAASLSSPGQSFSDAGGFWAFDDEEFEEGALMAVAVFAPGYGAQVQDRLRAEPEPDARAHVLRLYPEVKIAGQLRDADTGKPISGARVEIMPDRERGYGFFSRDAETVLSGADGAYQIAGVGPGRHRITVRAAGYLPKELAAFEVPRGPGSMQRNIQLKRGAVIAGQLHGDGGGWGRNVKLVLRPYRANSEEHAWSREQRTDNRGRFLFENVKDGIYALGRELPGTGLMAWEKLVRIRGLRSVDNLELLWQPMDGSTTLIGTLNGEKTIPKGMNVTLYADPDHYKGVPDEKRPPTRRVKANGTVFRFENLAEGHYRIAVSLRRGGESFYGRAKVSARGSETRVSLHVQVSKN